MLHAQKLSVHLKSIGFDSMQDSSFTPVETKESDSMSFIVKTSIFCVLYAALVAKGEEFVVSWEKCIKGLRIRAPLDIIRGI